MKTLDIWYEKYYNCGQGDMAFDYTSVEAELNSIQEGRLRLGFLDDDYNELLNRAAELSVELEEALEEFSYAFPQKNVQYDIRDSGAYWFNSAMALYNGTDMDGLLESEDKYGKNIYTEKSLRLRAVNALTKEQHLLLLSKTYSIVFRYFRLKTERDVLIGVNDELERLHSFKMKNGNIELPTSARM